MLAEVFFCGWLFSCCYLQSRSYSLSSRPAAARAASLQRTGRQLDQDQGDAEIRSQTEDRCILIEASRCIESTSRCQCTLMCIYCFYCQKKPSQACFFIYMTHVSSTTTSKLIFLRHKTRKPSFHTALRCSIFCVSSSVYIKKIYFSLHRSVLY